MRCCDQAPGCCVHGAIYENEEPVPETRDMEVEVWNSRDGFRITFAGQDLSHGVWRISPEITSPEPVVFWMGLEDGTWVYGPDGVWTRVEPEPRTWGQVIRDVFDRVSERLTEQIRSMRPVSTYDTFGQWTPAEADNNLGLLHGDYSDFRSEDPDDPFPPSQAEVNEQVRGLIVRYNTRPTIQPTPHPPWIPGGDYYMSEQNIARDGVDGGVPMSLEELLGADEKMDDIDRLLDED